MVQHGTDIGWFTTHGTTAIRRRFGIVGIAACCRRNRRFLRFVFLAFLTMCLMARLRFSSVIAASFVLRASTPFWIVSATSCCDLGLI
jgi:hypothetical protein